MGDYTYSENGNHKACHVMYLSSMKLIVFSRKSSLRSFTSVARIIVLQNEINPILEFLGLIFMGLYLAEIEFCAK